MWWALAIVACGGFERVDAEGPASEIPNVDTSTTSTPSTDDTATQSDTDTQTATETQTETDTPTFDCTADVDPQSVVSDCVTELPSSGTLECGDVLLSSTQSSTSVFDVTDYDAWHCLFYAEDEYLGNERAFLFRHPGTGYATLDLNTPCGELDLIVLRWEYWHDDQTCPTGEHIVNECESDVETGNGQVSIWQNTESHYVIVVDGPEPVQALFELSVSCD